ncbi:MAG: RES domain-containing protein [Verrucomicrobia bacterium]|jgi:RES domain-containing protein|nr:RES domain-containing protein [Verrucomicrobiota bacterium]
MPKDWKELVETAPTHAYQRKAKAKAQLLARYVPLKAFKAGSPPSYLYTSGNLNRCNPRGLACIYFGEGSETARAEFDSYYQKALTELGYYARTHLKAIIDLTDAATCKHFGLTKKDFTRSYAPKSGDLIPLQEIGKAVSRQSNIAAIRFPSNAMQKAGRVGYNLVVFQDLVSGSDFLEIMDGSKPLERWPKV